MSPATIFNIIIGAVIVGGCIADGAYWRAAICVVLVVAVLALDVWQSRRGTPP